MSSLNMIKQLTYKLLNTIFLLMLKYPNVADVIYIISERNKDVRFWVETGCHAELRNVQCWSHDPELTQRAHLYSALTLQTEESFCKFKCRGMSDSMQFDLVTCSLLRTPG